MRSNMVKFHTRQKRGFVFGAAHCIDAAEPALTIADIYSEFMQV